MVESIEHIPMERTRLANINARQDNNIVVFEEKIQSIKNMAISKRKIQELCQKSLEAC
jgi:hypothetical protein